MKPLSTVPALIVELDSEALALAAARTLEEIIVRQELSQPSMCELCFASLPADNLPRPGMKVVVFLGEEKAVLFSGETSAVEYIRRPGGERLVRVRAYDSLQNLRKKHSLRAYQQMTAAGLARE